MTKQKTAAEEVAFYTDAKDLVEKPDDPKANHRDGMQARKRALREGRMKTSGAVGREVAAAKLRAGKSAKPEPAKAEAKPKAPRKPKGNPAAVKE